MAQLCAQRYPWCERQQRREALLRPKVLHMQSSDLQSLCRIAWDCSTSSDVAALFGEGDGNNASLRASVGSPGWGPDGSMREKQIGREAFREYLASHVQRENGSKLREEEMADLWNAVDHSKTGWVSLHDFGALLHPIEAERQYHCRAKLLRGERKCAVGSAGQVHVSALARQGEPLPLLSPSRRQRSAGPAGGMRSSEEEFEKAKGMPQGGLKRALFVALQAMSGAINSRLDLPWRVCLPPGQPGSIDTVSGGTPLSPVEKPEGSEGGKGGFRPVVDVPWALALLVWPAAHLLSLAALAICYLLSFLALLIGTTVPMSCPAVYTGVRTAVSLPLFFAGGPGLASFALCMAVVLFLQPSQALPAFLLSLPPVRYLSERLLHLLARLFHRAQGKFTVRRVDLTRYSPWWVLIAPPLAAISDSFPWWLAPTVLLAFFIL